MTSPLPPARVRQSREDCHQPWPKLLSVVHDASISHHKQNRKTLSARVVGEVCARLIGREATARVLRPRYAHARARGIQIPMWQWVASWASVARVDAGSDL